MNFMGQRFENRDQLAKAFPAFAGDDAWRAIRAGASTPMEVEIHAWEWKNRHCKPALLAKQQAAYRNMGSGYAKRAQARAEKKRRKAA